MWFRLFLLLVLVLAQRQSSGPGAKTGHGTGLAKVGRVCRQHYRANDTYNESPQMLGILFDKAFLLSVPIALENTRAECCQQLDKCGTHTAAALPAEARLPPIAVDGDTKRLRDKTGEGR